MFSVYSTQLTQLQLNIKTEQLRYEQLQTSNDKEIATMREQFHQQVG